MKFDRSNKFDFMLLWAIKFATASKQLLGVTFILLAMVYKLCLRSVNSLFQIMLKNNGKVSVITCNFLVFFFF